MNLNYNPWKIKFSSSSSSSLSLSFSKSFQWFCCSCMFITINSGSIIFYWFVYWLSCLNVNRVCKVKRFYFSPPSTSHFWNSVLKTWLDLNYHDPSVPVPTLLWNNSHIKYQGNALVFTHWITGEILYVKDTKGPSGFITFQDIRNKIGNSPSRILKI